MAAKPKKTTKKPTAEEIKAKADKAEAKSKAAPKAETSSGKQSKAKAGLNEDQERALFLHHLKKFAGPEGLLSLKDRAVANLRNAYKTAKSDGFEKSDFDEAFRMQGAEGEKVRKAAIARSLRIAKWLGLDLGSQLDLFVQDERVPAADRSYEEGKSQAMLGISLQCDYAPETEQYRKFAEGWHDGQAVLAAGIGKLHPEVAKDEADKAVKAAKVNGQKEEDAKSFDAPTSGVPMTRAEYAAQQAQKPN